MLAQREVPRFIGRAADCRLHDGTIEMARHVADKLYVAVSPHQGDPVTLVFDGVTAVRACHPENLHFSSLVEWTDCPPLRGFEFANWFQPGDDWDPGRAEARLEIVAHSYHVTPGWIESVPPFRPSGRLQRQR